jgi:N-acetylglucosaminyldiphosphoundecaprenol N-acetyl-beta-D-mannosaminyltransferase
MTKSTNTSESFGQQPHHALLRIFDVLTSLLLILLLSPLLLLRALIGFIQTGRVFDRHNQIGRSQQSFERLSFAGSLSGKHLAVLFNILRGDLSWTGLRALEPEELASLPENAFFRFAVKPGLISPYTLKKKIGIAYDDELSIDRHR